MATATAHPTPAMPASRWPYLLAYLAAVVVAEVLISIPGGSGGQDRPLQSIGLGIHILLVFTLMFLSVVIQPKDATLAPLLVAASLASLVRVFSLATGFSEELIFRAILLKRAVEGLGPRGGLLYVTAIFASLHIFFLNGVDLVFVFAVGLFYGIVVLKTRSLWGVILSHSLGNVILYLVCRLLLEKKNY